MKSECHPQLCLPVPILESTDLTGKPDPRDRAHIAICNKERRKPARPTTSGPYSADLSGTRAQMLGDQFWEGTNGITILNFPGTGEVGTLFATRNTTFIPPTPGIPNTVDTWTEDWVILDMNAFSGAHEVVIKYEDPQGSAADYIFGKQQLGTAPIHKMSVTFQYQSFPPLTPPSTFLPNKQCFAVRNTPGGAAIRGYMFREKEPDSTGTGEFRNEYWVLFGSYTAPHQKPQGTRLTPITDLSDGTPIDTLNAADFVDKMNTLHAAQIAFYVETHGILAQV